jgi:hypothetical protein
VLDFKKKVLLGVIVLLVIGICIYLKKRKLVTIWVEDVPLKVEVSDTPFLRRRGLMYRKSLPQNQGMLFIFDEPGFHSFWMKNTSIPLSIAFISEDKEIIQIDSMTPYDIINFHSPKKPIKYAIEVNQGWFGKHKIKVGDKIRGSILK